MNVVSQSVACAVRVAYTPHLGAGGREGGEGGEGGGRGEGGRGGGGGGGGVVVVSRMKPSIGTYKGTSMGYLTYTVV